MSWEEYKDEFDFDGSWRDIYVLSTTIQDWQQAIYLIRAGVYFYRCWIGGEESNLLPDATAIFEAEYEFKPLVSINVGLVRLNCHFFVPGIIEFDLDPREIRTQVEAEQVFDFMRQLSQILNKEVILTPENAPEYPIFKYSPGRNDFQYIPFGPYLDL